MGPTWLTSLAALLVGAGGIGTVLGLVVQHQNNKAQAIAAATASAIDGLKTVSVEQRAELDRLYKQLADRDARIAQLEAGKNRRTT